jgi:beta-lactamase superfamily II metal-dependent hydrolase
MIRQAYFVGVIAALALVGGTAQAAAEKPLQIVVVDVEGGAATLYVTAEGKSLLVDTGWPPGMGGARPVAGAPPPPPQPSSADRIVAAAHELGLTKIDYLLMSHYHVDHLGGLYDLLGKIPVGVMIDHGPNREPFTPTANRPAPDANQPVSAYPRYETTAVQHSRHSVKAGERMKIGSLTLDFVTSDAQAITTPLVPGMAPTAFCETAGTKAENGGEENPRSAGFVATYGKTRIMALADTTWDQELKLVCPANLIGPIDLLLVSHHGANLSNSRPLIAAAAPRVALMANGSRKGGDKATFVTLAETPSKPAVWQVHEAIRDPDANRPADYIANLNGPIDSAYSLKAAVFKSGKITVTNARNGFTQSYAAAK